MVNVTVESVLIKVRSLIEFSSHVPPPGATASTPKRTYLLSNNQPRTGPHLLLISDMIIGPIDLQGQHTCDRGCVCVRECVYTCKLPLISTHNGRRE